MGHSTAGTTIVEALAPIQVAGQTLPAGTRLLAWESGSSWVVILNGSEAKVPAGAVGTIDSSAVRDAVEKRSAREEEYQLAPQ